MISILLPTAKRPELLAKALSSIADQTALSQVGEVIVSESAGDTRSGEVCRQFPNLPIKYVLRDPQMQMTEHFSALKKAKWGGEFTAILHDDDWWTPDFLSHAIDSLTNHPDASSYCCCSYDVFGESSLLSCNAYVYFWFGADYAPLQPIWKLTTQSVMLASLLATPAHYSTIVARAEALRQAAAVYDTHNTWDADRMLVYQLSRLGPIVYSPLPKAFYRFHPAQLTHLYSREAKDNQMKLTTKWIVEQSGETWSDAGQLFAERLKRCPPEARDLLYSQAMQPWSLPVIAQEAGLTSEIGQIYQSLLPKVSDSFKKAVRMFVPPIIWQGGSNLRRRLKA